MAVRSIVFALSLIVSSTSLFSCKKSSNGGGTINQEPPGKVPKLKPVDSDIAGRTRVDTEKMSKTEATVSQQNIGEHQTIKIDVNERPANTDFIQFTICQKNKPEVCDPGPDEPGEFVLNSTTIYSPPAGELIITLRACTRRPKNPLLVCGPYKTIAFNHNVTSNDAALESILNEQYQAEQAVRAECTNIYDAIVTYNQLDSKSSSEDLRKAMANLEEMGVDSLCEIILAGGLTFVDQQLDAAKKPVQDDNSDESKERDEREDIATDSGGLNGGERGAIIALGSLTALTGLSVSFWAVYEKNKLDNEYAKLQSELEASQEQLRILKQDKASIDARNSQLRQEIEGMVDTRKTEIIQELDGNQRHLAQQIAAIEDSLKAKRFKSNEIAAKLSQMNTALESPAALQQEILSHEKAMQQSREKFNDLIKGLTQKKVEFETLRTRAQQLSKSGLGELTSVEEYLKVQNVDQKIRVKLLEKRRLSAIVNAPTDSADSLMKQINEINDRTRELGESVSTYRSSIAQLDAEIKGLGSEIHGGEIKLATETESYLQKIRTQLFPLEGGQLGKARGRLVRIDGHPPLVLAPGASANSYRVLYGDLEVGSYTEAVLGEPGGRGFKPNIDVIKPVDTAEFLGRLTKISRESKHWATFDSLYAVSGSSSDITANSGKWAHYRSAIDRLEVQQNYSADSQGRLEKVKTLESAKAKLIEAHAQIEQLANAKEKHAARRKLIVEDQERLRSLAKGDLIDVDLDLKKLATEKSEVERVAKKRLSDISGRNIGGLEDSVFRDIKSQLQFNFERYNAQVLEYERQIAIEATSREKIVSIEHDKLQRLTSQLESLRGVLPADMAAESLESIKQEIAEQNTILRQRSDELARIELASQNRGEIARDPKLVEITDKMKANNLELERLDRSLTTENTRFSSLDTKARSSSVGELNKKMFAGGLLIFGAGIVSIVIATTLGLNSEQEASDLVIDYINAAEIRLRNALVARDDAYLRSLQHLSQQVAD